MNRLEEIKNKYDFYFGEGNPEIDSVADSDTSWLINRVNILEETLKNYMEIQCEICGLTTMNCDIAELFNSGEESK